MRIGTMQCFMNTVYQMFLSTFVVRHFTHLVVGRLHVITSGQGIVSRSHMDHSHAIAPDCQSDWPSPRGSEKVAALLPWVPEQQRSAEALLRCHTHEASASTKPFFEATEVLGLFVSAAQQPILIDVIYN